MKKFRPGEICTSANSDLIDVEICRREDTPFGIVDRITMEFWVDVKPFHFKFKSIKEVVAFCRKWDVRFKHSRLVQYVMVSVLHEGDVFIKTGGK